MSPQYIKDYLLENFGDSGKLSASQAEFIMPSLFTKDDWKRHMSVNVDTGLWQCFKTGKKGNFISLYAEAEDITYHKAQTDLIIKNFGFLGTEPLKPVKEVKRKSAEIDASSLIPVSIESAYSENPAVASAWSFVFGRKLFNEVDLEEEPYYLCTEGRFAGRLIIPFRKDNNVYYFQARALNGEEPKYLNPASEGAVRSSDVVYPFNESEDYVVVCEGPLDAVALQRQGVNATCTIGSTCSRAQAEILCEFGGKVILGYDNDAAGEKGIKRFDQLRKELRMASFEVCPPPSGYKDWNDAHIDGFDLFSWITEKTQTYDFEYLVRSLLE